MEQEVMQAIRAELESNIDAKYREFHSSLVPGQNCRILGVRIPVSRRIAKATARDHYEVYTEQFNPEVYEELLIRGMMIGYGRLTREEQTAELDRFVPMINSWGICDSSCATCHFMKKDQEYWYGYLQKWLKSSREYEIRFWCCVSAGLFYQRSVYRCCAGGDEKDSSRWLLRKKWPSPGQYRSVIFIFRKRHRNC
mgnify:CR=1 FL=1